jgi:hypothetical protein
MNIKLSRVVCSRITHVPPVSQSHRGWREQFSDPSEYFSVSAYDEEKRSLVKYLEGRKQIYFVKNISEALHQPIQPAGPI